MPAFCWPAGRPVDGRGQADFAVVVARAARRPSAVPAGPGRHHRASRAWFDEQGFPRGRNRRFCRSRPGNETHLHAPRTEIMRPDGGACEPATCGPRRNSPARSCWRRARRRFSNSRGCFVTASAATCICPNSPCWNGTAPTPPMMPSWPTASSSSPMPRRRPGSGNFSFRGRTADPFAEPELVTVAGAFERFAGIDLLPTISGGEGDRAALAQAAGAQGAGGGGRHLVRHLQQGPGRACRAAIWGRGV